MATINAIDSNIPISASKGGTGATTLLDNAVLVGSGTAAVTALTVGTNGQVLIGSTAADPVFGNITSGDSTITISEGAGTLALSTGTAVAISFPTDSGTATPASGVLTMTGGTNINTSGATSVVTVNVDSDLVTMDSITFNTGGELRTGVTDTNTLLLEAYDVDGTSYTTFATLTAGNTPTMDLDEAVTKSGGYIYRAGGTDVPVADGGTGVSSTTAYAPVVGGTTTTNPFQSADTGISNSGYVLTSTGAASIPTWQAAGSGGLLTWTEVTGTSQSAAVDNGYITNNAGLVTVTLPSTAAVGEVVRIAGKGAGGWLLAQNASQVVHFASVDTTTGVGGSLASTTQYDGVYVVCVTANTDWVVVSSIGNLTYV